MAKNDDLGLGVLLGIGALARGAIGLSLKHDKALAEERVRRRAVTINWPDGLSQEVFETICRMAAKSIRRLKIIFIRTVCFIKVDGYSDFSTNQMFESDCLVEIGFFISRS